MHLWELCYRGLHDTAGHLIPPARPPELKQLVDMKGKEKEIFDCKEDHPHVCKCNYFLRPRGENGRQSFPNSPLISLTPLLIL